MEIEEGKGVSHQKRVMRKIPLFDIPQKVHIFSLKNVLIYLYVIYKKLCTKISGKHAVLMNILLPKIGFPSPGMSFSETSSTSFSWSALHTQFCHCKINYGLYKPIQFSFSQVFNFCILHWKQDICNKSFMTLRALWLFSGSQHA